MPVTAEERKAASGIPFLPVGVTPNSSKDDEWRRQAAFGYSGNLEFPNHINTLEKRRTVAGIPFLPPAIVPNPYPDEAWRKESGHSYKLDGITPPYNTPVPIGRVVRMWMKSRRHGINTGS